MRPELDLKGWLIKVEASVCYRLLRNLNSAAFGLKHEVHSVKHALSMLGDREVRRWICLVAAVGAGQQKPSDRVLSALVRARFAEWLTPKVEHGESDLFLLGLLSRIDPCWKCRWQTYLKKCRWIAKAVLLGQPSILRPVYPRMLAHESGEWQAAGPLSQNQHRDAEEVSGFYWQAQPWAREVSVGR